MLCVPKTLISCNHLNYETTQETKLEIDLFPFFLVKLNKEILVAIQNPTLNSNAEKKILFIRIHFNSGWHFGFFLLSFDRFVSMYFNFFALFSKNATSKLFLINESDHKSK